MTASRTPAVRLESVSKRFALYGSPLRQVLGHLGLGSLKVGHKVALEDINLTIARGERVGVVGRNGSGKTTLLRLIIGHTRPTRGRVLVQGTVQALMHTGYGFIDDLTGLENIRNALVYNGLPEHEVADAEADIIEFVELGEFLHHPLRTYSLGMRARLEFAAATAIRPDVLVIDEVLGAGDGYFARKCIGRMRRLMSDATVVLVSHSLDQIREYCERVVWLDGGKVRADGPASGVLDQYRQHMVKQSVVHRHCSQSRTVPVGKSDRGTLLAKVRQLFGIGTQVIPGRECARILEFHFASTDEKACVMETGDQLDLRLVMVTERAVRPVVLGMSEEGRFVFELNAEGSLPKGRHAVAVRNARLGVGSGRYVLVPALRDAVSEDVVTIGESTLDLEIAVCNWSDPPLMHLDGRWYSGAARTPIEGKVSGWV